MSTAPYSAWRMLESKKGMEKAIMPLAIGPWVKSRCVLLMEKPRLHSVYFFIISLEPGKINR